MFNKLFFVLLIAISCVAAEKFRFDNFTLYKVFPKTVDQFKVLQNLQASDLRYDFWSDPVPSAEFVTVMSAPEHKSNFETFLSDHNFEVNILMKNVQEAIDKESVRRYTKSNIRSMTWDAYYVLEDIYVWLDDLVATYPSIVTAINPAVLATGECLSLKIGSEYRRVNGGTTYEGRTIKGIKISHGPGRRAIFLEAGIHSREWISPSTANYITNELLTSNDEATMAAAQGFDWYIFPVINPDGYVWSHESFRLWRKNRRQITTTVFGVDLNRNWNNNWLVIGASADPASDRYAGAGPFSEIETRALSSYIRTLGNQIDLYLSFHSFGQLLMIPFGNSTEPYGNYHDALNIGRRAVGALSVKYGTRYVVGNIAEAIFHASGGSVDWVKEAVQVPLVYCYELRDQGTYGFLLPTDQILPNHLETMDSLLELIHQAKRFGYMNNATALESPLIVFFSILIMLRLV